MGSPLTGSQPTSMARSALPGTETQPQSVAPLGLARNWAPAKFQPEGLRWDSPPSNPKQSRSQERGPRGSLFLEAIIFIIAKCAKPAGFRRILLITTKISPAFPRGVHSTPNTKVIKVEFHINIRGKLAYIRGPEGDDREAPARGGRGDSPKGRIHPQKAPSEPPKKAEAGLGGGIGGIPR
jgi:hypothetical protein